MSEANGLATRELLSQPPVVRYEVVDIPDWGQFRIRSLTELQRSKLEASFRDKSGQLVPSKLVDHKSRLIVLCWVDADGNQVLTHNDIDSLHKQDSRHTNALFDAIQKHCGISDADVEELEKNSEATPTAN